MQKQNEGHRSQILLSHLAGDEGFEPPIAEPESAALPLGQSPLLLIINEPGVIIADCVVHFQMLTKNKHDDKHIL